MKIINISGKAMHGKDTTALIIKEKLEAKNKKVLITHYADLVKYTCKTYFNWDGNKDEKGRGILQRIGTDVVRTQKPNYWVDFVKGFLEMFQNDWDYVLIPDCRFPNELSSWEEDNWDTISVRIKRINFESTLTPEQLIHPSETALDKFAFDYCIYNDGDLKQLENEVDKFINYLGG